MTEATEKRKVTATLKSNFALRQGGKAEGKTLVLSSFQVTTNNQTKNFQFLNEAGEPEDLVIETVREFDLSLKAQEHNWKMLQLWNALYGKDVSPQMILHDPYEQSENDAKRAKTTFGIHKVLMEKQSDSDWLAKVYRRVVGVTASGVTAKIAFTRLYQEASLNPDKFMYNGTLVYESSEFENMALIDLALEKGALLKDKSGMIKQSDGKPLAKDYAEAVFFLDRNPEVKQYVLRTINREPEPFKAATKKVELSAEAMALFNEAGSGVGGPALNEDGSLAQKTEEQQREDIKTLVDKLIEKALVMQKPAGNSTVYRLDEFADGVWHPKHKIIAYFEANKNEADRYSNLL